ncbi:helix-turn-helix transcriptional regulator [Ketobacter alkanivorans]|uniref:Transcriptional regulator n=1 Tax=Ketobacter alkanivorans TaxID=1917421 RepID=A0A2K9LHZ0_9GAMM|nr:AlpA family phage regulatory protein [Ketobacter alkanivorans]AUM11978.1 transcriptional regulator [Ketobacter alkanivorans]
MVSTNPDRHTLPPTGFIRLDDILKIFPIGKSTWWQGIKDGRYPKGIKLSPRTTAWRVEDIQNLIDSLQSDEG